MQRILSFAARTTVACALMGVVGCGGPIRSISVTSTPSSAKVEIRKMDGTVVGQGQTPMTAGLKHGKDYTVTISLAGYQPQTIPVRSITDIDHNFDEFCGELACVMLTAAVTLGEGEYEPSSTTEFESKFEPSYIHVELKEATSLDGSDTAIYTFLTIVYENGKHQHATVEMIPASVNGNNRKR